MPNQSIQNFIARWQPSGGSERSNYQMFLTELCDVLEVDHPDPASVENAENAYVFERSVPLDNRDGTTTTGFVDLYKRDAFVCETKQGVEKREDQDLLSGKQKAKKKKRKSGHGTRGTKTFDEAMRKAHGQAQNYARSLPAVEGRPPFLVVVDVGHTIELYSEFSQTGGAYVPFPDPQSHRIKLADLADDNIRERLRLVWTAPLELDPARKSAKVTRDIAGNLAQLAKRLEEAGHHAEDVAHFLMRCLFTMFAEDVGLLPEDCFKKMLQSLDNTQHFVPVVEDLWRTMNSGGFSAQLRKKLLYFNGGLFADSSAIAIDRDQLDLLIEAAEADWQDVEPAIFGTLLERALDPACGTGNFLYVTLEHLKRIEGEVFADLAELGEKQMLLESGHTVDPHQLLGIEINPRAAAIAELVLWIGYLQWHFRTRGDIDPPEPVIKNFKNIECRDAVLDYTSREIVLDDENKPVTIWDGRTTKTHPVTGQEVPDETARVSTYRYLNPKKAEWPEADFVVGNPPFAGDKRMRTYLGSGYVDALRHTYKDLPASADLVMYWWHIAAEQLHNSKIRQFGLITTNSINQSFNRKIVEKHLGRKEIAFVFAIADHPWVDSSDGAGVRIAMTCLSRAETNGLLGRSVSELPGETGESFVSLDFEYGVIMPDLRIGISATNLENLAANEGVAANGVGLYGQGFLLKQDQFVQLQTDSDAYLDCIHPFVGGRDLTDRSRELKVIDLLGMSEEETRSKFPEVYQWILDRVKPERMQNNRASYREKWWVFGEPRSRLRRAWGSVKSMIGTPRTAKHRFFTFLPEGVIPETEVIAIATDDPLHLAVLSGTIHVLWSRFTGTKLESRPRYNSSRVFSTFPFPAATESQKSRIRELGEQLDAHRKRQQQLHEKLTMTGMYNVLEKLRSVEGKGGEELTAKEKTIHEQGLVSVLKQIHDDLDAAVADAYGWPVDLADEEILERIVALNHERAGEEKRGLIRWLRPEFQNPDGKTQQGMEQGAAKGVSPAKEKAAKIKKLPWPKSLSEQAAAVQSAIVAIAEPVDEKLVAKRFTRANKDRIAELLETLTSLGRARQLDDGRYVAV